MIGVKEENIQKKKHSAGNFWGLEGERARQNDLQEATGAMCVLGRYTMALRDLVGRLRKQLGQGSSMLGYHAKNK